MSVRPSLAALTVALLAAALVAASGCEAKPQTEVSGVQIGPPPGQDDLAKLPADPVTNPYGSPNWPVGGSTDPIPPGPPAGGLTDPIPPAPPAGNRIHVMAKGENLFRLAIKYYGSGSQANVQKIMAANPSYPDPSKIPVGAKIVIP